MFYEILSKMMNHRIRHYFYFSFLIGFISYCYFELMQRNNLLSNSLKHYLFMMCVSTLMVSISLMIIGIHKMKHFSERNI
jgi:ABC-type transport system involved in cytochrome c biogenesis permease subunit